MRSLIKRLFRKRSDTVSEPAPAFEGEGESSAEDAFVRLAAHDYEWLDKPRRDRTRADS